MLETRAATHGYNNLSKKIVQLIFHKSEDSKTPAAAKTPRTSLLHTTYTLAVEIKQSGHVALFPSPIPIPDSTIILVNTVGLILQLSYVTIYHTYAENKASHLYLHVDVAWGWAAAVVYLSSQLQIHVLIY